MKILVYYAERCGSIVAAVALIPFQNENYHPVEWGAELKDDEVSVVHILCVDPNMQKRGVAAKVMEEAARLTENAGKKAVRLDALCCNEPAHRLYEKCGFVKRGVQNWYADNTGRIDFFLYKLALQ